MRVSRGESVCPPPAPAPTQAAGKMGGALHCGWMGGGGGRGTQKPSCARRKRARLPSFPQQSVSSQDTPWSASPTSALQLWTRICLALGRRWELGRPQTGWGQAHTSVGRVFWVSGGSEDSGAASCWDRDIGIGRPGGSWALRIFLIIGANGVL